MYPVLRMGWEALLARRLPPLRADATHVSSHVCWPWDIDLWMELNNGRTLTLYDLGRIPLVMRTGLLRVLARHRWGLTVAGSAVRYRRRIRPFDRFTMRSRLIGWDHRFLYAEQSMWRGDTCCGQAVFRLAVTAKTGIVAFPQVVEAFEGGLPKMTLPDWVEAWIAAEDMRPWPPARA
jgi:acyl-CoA thioesterase FadM